MVEEFWLPDDLKVALASLLFKPVKSKLFLKSPLDFKRVLNNEEVFFGRFFIIKRALNNLDSSRYGIIVSKKTGGAVVRNRIKRLVREVMRKQQLNSCFDIVVIAKRLSASADFYDVNTDLLRSLSKASLI